MTERPEDQHSNCPDCAQSPAAHSRATTDRRTFLRRSLYGLMGMSLGGPLFSLVSDGRAPGVSALFANEMNAVLPLPQDAAVKSIIVLWMNGGPSQMETFDPKPGNANGGPTRAIKTAVKGLQISEHLPQLAEVADRMAVVRCMQTGEGNHARARELMRTGFRPNPTVAYPGIGSIVAFERGDASASLPQNVAINQPGQPAGLLGLEFDPLHIGNPQRGVENLAPARGVSGARIDRRMQLMLAQNESFRARVGGASWQADGHSAVMRDAVDFMRAEEAGAFDLSEEPEALKEAYGTGQFGQGCLMARRLVEAGVKYVEVTLNGWDTHDDNFTRSGALAGELDPAMATLIRDLEERELLDSTLVVCMGEFGRTPRINNREGRDHFAQAWSVAMAGGGFRPGTVIGETSSDGMNIVGNAVTPADLFRTILWSAGIDPDTEYYSPTGRPVKYADGGRVITALVGAA